MLARSCSRLLRSAVGAKINKINYQLPYSGNKRWDSNWENVRFVSVTSKLGNNEDPCKAKDVYKVSPLCPPRGYEYKKKPVSLKCPPKKPCPSVTKKDAKPKEPPKDEKKDCPQGKQPAKEAAKKEAKKDAPKKDDKSCKEEVKVQPKKEEPKKEPPKKDCPTKEEKQCAKKELKGCKKPEEAPTCGKTPDECSIELPKSVSPSPQKKRTKVRPGMKLDCPPRTKQEMEKKCQKKECCDKQAEVETCCSPRPWPFNLFDKACNKKPKKQCPVKSDEKKNAKKKMVAVSPDSLTCSISRAYSTTTQENESKEFHTSCKDDMRPVCPPCPNPLCSGGIDLSEETKKLMVKLRAVGRANRRRQPETCVPEPQAAPCFVPSDGWGKTHDFILMRDPQVLKKLPKKVYDTPRLVTRKLRKKQ